MFVDTAFVVPSVTKTNRKDSPGLRPAGVLRAMPPASTRTLVPIPIQISAVAIASRRDWVNMRISFLS